jgi:hypothetical protein
MGGRAKWQRVGHLVCMRFATLRPRNRDDELEREELNSIAIRVRDLHPHRGVVVLPLKLGHALLPQNVPCRADFISVLELETEM